MPLKDLFFLSHTFSTNVFFCSLLKIRKAKRRCNTFSSLFLSFNEKKETHNAFCYFNFVVVNIKDINISINNIFAHVVCCFCCLDSALVVGKSKHHPFLCFFIV